MAGAEDTEMGRGQQDRGGYTRVGSSDFMSSAVARCWGVLSREVIRPD